MKYNEWKVFFDRNKRKKEFFFGRRGLEPGQTRGEDSIARNYSSEFLIEVI